MSIRAQIKGIRDRQFLKSLSKKDSLLLAKPQMVSTSRGWIQIQKLKKGDKVLGYDAVLKKQVWNTITEIEEFPKSKYFLLVNGKYVFNWNQSVFANGNVTHAKLLKIGDSLSNLFDSRIKVSSVKRIHGTAKFPKFKIDGNHTYYIDGILVHNASRFWVGGTATWNATNTTNWSASSGGAGGASVPTSADDVTFDSASSGAAYTCTIGATDNCANLTMGAPATGKITWAGSSALNIYGSLNLSGGTAGITRTYTGAITFAATATGKTITMAGVQLLSNVNFNGVGGGWQFQDAFYAGTGNTNYIQITAGALDTNGQTVTAGYWNQSGSTTRSVTLGASTINLNASGDIWRSSTITNLTFNAGTSNISMNNNSSMYFYPGSTLTYYDITFGNGGGSALFMGAVNSCHNLNCTAPRITFYNITITGTLTITGASQTSRTWASSYIEDSASVVITITAAAVSLTNVDFLNITAAGAAAPFTGTSLGDCGNCTQITFTTAVTRYWRGNGGNWNDTTHWSTSSGGAGGATMPLPQDTVLFDNNSFSSGSQTVTANILFLGKDIDWTGVAQTPTWALGSTERRVQGYVTLVSGMNLSGTSYLTFSGVGNTQILTTNTKSLPFYVRCWNRGGTIQLADNLTITHATGLQVSMGTLDAATAGITSVTIPALSMPNQRTRVLTMGSATWTVNGTGSIWNISKSNGGVTINCGTSKILIPGNASARTFGDTFPSGSVTYYDFEISGAGTGAVQFNGSMTIHNFKVFNAPKTINIGLPSYGNTWTFQSTSTIDMQGSFGNLITLRSTTSGSKFYWTVPSGVTQTVKFVDVKDTTASGVGSPIDDRPGGVDSGNVSGWKFTVGTVQARARIKRTFEYGGGVGAITHDTDSSTKTTGTAVSSISWNHTVNNGNKRLLLVELVGYPASATSVTFNSVPLTLYYQTSNWETVSFWYLVNPDVGTYSIQVNFGSASKGVFGASSWFGVNQISPFRGSAITASNNNTSPTVSISSQVGDVVHDALGVYLSGSDTTLTVDASQTQRWQDADTTECRAGASSEAGGGTTVMSWTLGVAKGWTTVAVVLKPDPIFSAKARILVGQEKTATAKARIFNTLEKPIQAKADIKQFAIPETVSAKARVKVAQEKSSQVKARILKVQSKTIQTKADIKNTANKTVQAKARVKQAGTGKSIQAKARVVFTRNKTAQAKARIFKVQSRTATARARVKQVDQTKATTAKARIGTSINQTAQAKARLLKIQEKTANARARIHNTVSKSAQAKARIRLGGSKDIDARARILKVQSKTAQTKARIKKLAAIKTSQAKARIKVAANMKTATAKAKILKVQNKTIQARARVKKLGTTKTAAAKARIKKTSSPTAQAKAKIKLVQTKTSQVKARVKRAGVTKTVAAKSRIKTTSTRTIQTKAKIWAARLGSTRGRRAALPGEGKRGIAQIQRGNRNPKGTAQKSTAQLGRGQRSDSNIKVGIKVDKNG